jgi:hypothetical protein
MCWIKIRPTVKTIYWKIDCEDDLLEDAIEGEFFRWSGRCPFDLAELAMHKGCCDVGLNFSVK